MVGIYKITNLINNKIYIGQSIDIKQRWYRHRTAAFNESYPQYNCLLYKAIRKYGLNNFKFEVLELCSEDELNNKEEYYISFYNSSDATKGYNMITSIVYSENSHITQETAEQIRQLLLNSKISQTEIAKEFSTTQMTVSSINLGKAWRDDFYTYPIRPKKKHNYCVDCGKEITPEAQRCDKCSREYRKKQYILPVSREELKLLIRNNSFLSIGKRFGVSDNAIRKWCDKYGLPRRVIDIKGYTDMEWEKI